VESGRGGGNARKRERERERERVLFVLPIMGQINQSINQSINRKKEKREKERGRELLFFSETLNIGETIIGEDARAHHH
jgi:hypothetical protein